jgi:uncharacterized protein YecE (DUF72 family)
MKLLVGTSGFGYKEWLGKFYPEKIPPKEMLGYYAQRLPTVEINNTFYQQPTEAVLSSWAEQVPEDFIFAFKTPQVITHFKRLHNVEDEAAYFFRTLERLNQRLGPVLVQFPKNFKANPPLLANFFELIPPYIACAFEFRSPTWLTGEVFDLLKSRNFSLCTPDADDNPPAEIIKTASWGYLRLRRAGYPAADLSRWLEQIRTQLWDRAFVYFKHEETAKGPETARRFLVLDKAVSSGGTP